MEDIKKQKKKEYNLKYNLRKKKEIEMLKQTLENKEKENIIEPIYNNRGCQTQHQPKHQQQEPQTPKHQPQDPSQWKQMTMGIFQQVATTLILGAITVLPRLLSGGGQRMPQPSMSQQQQQENILQEAHILSLNSLKHHSY